MPINKDGEWYDVCPYNTKTELVKWALLRWPHTPKTTFKNMSKKQLYALWYNSNKKERNSHGTKTY